MVNSFPIDAARAVPRALFRWSPARRNRPLSSPPTRPMFRPASARRLFKPRRHLAAL